MPSLEPSLVDLAAEAPVWSGQPGRRLAIVAIEMPSAQRCIFVTPAGEAFFGPPGLSFAKPYEPPCRGRGACAF